MRKRNNKHGYSSDLAQEYIDNGKAIINLSTQVEKLYVWKENKRTAQVSGYQAWFSQEGVEPFKVKFAKKPELPPYLSQVNLINLEACEVRYNVYFRASDLKEF
ncbi:MAG: hypothetical protein Q3960_03010 [Lactobacillus sp.]|nr:hypothetical protein [Lactobacillus sp.]